mmetsp:Transcript_76297/g.213196  ORF Transcript_76297/g.213196 Transcript_76297/m.213196 type:complete len:156 (+) Transcript_76297:46-513(+)
MRLGAAPAGASGGLGPAGRARRETAQTTFPPPLLPDGAEPAEPPTGMPIATPSMPTADAEAAPESPFCSMIGVPTICATPHGSVAGLPVGVGAAVLDPRGRVCWRPSFFARKEAEATQVIHTNQRTVIPTCHNEYPSAERLSPGTSSPLLCTFCR